MSISALPQLLEVDSELTAQVAALEAQLRALQEKRKGIQTVMGMFDASGQPRLEDIAAFTQKTSKSEPAKASKSAKASTRKKTKKSPTRSSVKAAAKTKTAKAKATTKLKATRGRPAKAKTTSSVASKTTGKRSGRTANWQSYVQDSYSQAALPDVIVGVLQAQPSNVFKIADVMSAVFKEDMPKGHYLKARNRVSNILSAGARDGDWFRGRGGTYSATAKAIKSAS